MLLDFLLKALLGLALLAATQVEAKDACAGKADGALVPKGGCTSQYYVCLGGKVLATQSCNAAAKLVWNPAIPGGGNCAQVGGRARAQALLLTAGPARSSRASTAVGCSCVVCRGAARVCGPSSAA